MSEEVQIVDTVVEEKQLETIDINDVEIFSTGVWEGKGSPKGGSVIDEKYLDSLVESFNKVGEKVKPRMTIGHDSNRSQDVTGLAALGWIKKLGRKGNKLTADIAGIPKKLSSLISKGAFGRFSPGIYDSLNVNGENVDNVLDHVALLGAQLPANMDLDGLIDLYEIENIENITTYENKIKEKTMDENKIVEFEKRIANLETEKKEAEGKLQEYEKSIQEKDELIQNLEADKKRSFEKEIDTFLQSKVQEGKILPSQIAHYTALALSSNMVEYSHIEDNEQKKVKGNPFDVVKEIIENNTEMVNFGQEDSKAVEIDKTEKSDDDKLDEKVKLYAKENSISYAEAFEQIAIEEGGE